MHSPRRDASASSQASGPAMSGPGGATDGALELLPGIAAAKEAAGARLAEGERRGPA